MPNLLTFIDRLNSDEALHINSFYLFDWPGVFPAIHKYAMRGLDANKPIIQSIALDGVKAKEYHLHIDGHAVPVYGTPNIPHELSFEMLLQEDFMNKTYGILLDMFYSAEENSTVPTTSGISLANYNRHNKPTANAEPGECSTIARLYTVSPTYQAKFEVENITKHPHFEIHYPRVKQIEQLSFSSRSSEFSKVRVSIAFAWLNVFKSKFKGDGPQINPANRPDPGQIIMGTNPVNYFPSGWNTR